MSRQQADFVIIGGGTSGITLAARLSEDPNVSVLVIEAGNDMSQDPRVVTPAMWPSLLGTDAAWNFTSTPQRHVSGRSLPMTGGKMIGGSTGLNGCAFIANSRTNVDAWQSIGNPGWGWDDMLPYYKKVYTLTLPSAEMQKELGLEYVDPQLHGSGPIQVSFPDRVVDPIARAWVKSLSGLGWPMKTDPFSGQAVGGYINGAIIDPNSKTRSYAGNAYFSQAKERPNFQVITSAQVQKIILKQTSEGHQATGVEYIKDGKVETAEARSEVILSAGALNSPKVLELSGIGHKDILSAVGIETLVESPGVGEHLQDHVLVGVSFEVEDGIETKDDVRRQDPKAIGAAMEAYQTSQSGTFSVGGDYCSALLPVPDFQSESGKAEMEEILAGVSSPAPGSFESDLQKYALAAIRDPNEATGGYFFYAARADFKGPGTTTQVEDLFEGTDKGNHITILTRLMNPLSLGTVHIASKELDAAPLINPAWLSHPLDSELLARHLRYIDEIATSEPLRSQLKKDGARTPGIARDFRRVPLQESKDYIAAAAVTSWHLTGTCAMMPRSKGGVVDSRLRVYGVKNLRVVDASIIPICPRANSQTSAYAVAEKAADLIREDLKLRST